MKKVKQIYKVVIIFFIMILSLGYNISFAAQDSSSDDVEEATGFSQGSWISPDYYDPGELNDGGEIINIGNEIIGILRFVGSFASVIFIVVIGIKYMMGSVEEKAEYKKTMWPYFVGALLVFGITTFLSIIEAIAKEI